MTDEPTIIDAPVAEGNTDAQSAESVGAAVVGEKSGRKPPEYYKRSVMEIIDEAAPLAAIVLAENVKSNLQGQGKKHPMLVAGLKETCMYLVNQAIGKPRQRIETVGVQLTYSDLAKAAASIGKGKGRPVLADVFELSHQVTAGAADRPAVQSPADACGDPPASELGDVD